MKEAGWQLRLVRFSDRATLMKFLIHEYQVTRFEAQQFLHGHPLPASETDSVDRTFLQARIEQQTGASLVWERSNEYAGHPGEVAGAS